MGNIGCAKSNRVRGLMQYILRSTYLTLDFALSADRTQRKSQFLGLRFRESFVLLIQTYRLSFASCGRSSLLLEAPERVDCAGQDIPVALDPG